MDLTDLSHLSEDYQRIEQAIHYIEANAGRQPELEEVAAAIGLSEYHFQRLFTRWAGISPKRFLQYLTKENAKAWLARSSNLLEVTYAAGLSSPGRLHDLFIQTEAVTPGEYKSHGQGLHIRYGFQPSPFGECLLALTDRGICSLSFTDGDRQTGLDELRHEWSGADLAEDAVATAAAAAHIFGSVPRAPLALHLHGTNFQIKVWEALLRLPAGAVVSYESLAEQIGETGAARAVGNAVGRNPVAFLIPCHRVLQKTGEFGNYRYGSARKKAILLREFAAAEAGSISRG
jgi:AraC family transcriptional regulator, regulatory protein of adaptative response / methylated-DNA-[protein]-cysteine methyltransferase